MNSDQIYVSRFCWYLRCLEEKIYINCSAGYPAGYRISKKAGYPVQPYHCLISKQSKDRAWIRFNFMFDTKGGGTGRKIPKKRAFLFTPQISLCINLESWNFLCTLLKTLSRTKSSQIWNPRSFDLQYLGSKSRPENLKLWHFLTDFRVWWLKMTQIECTWVIHG